MDEFYFQREIAKLSNRVEALESIKESNEVLNKLVSTQEELIKQLQEKLKNIELGYL